MGMRVYVSAFRRRNLPKSVTTRHAVSRPTIDPPKSRSHGNSECTACPKEGHAVAKNKARNATGKESTPNPCLQVGNESFEEHCVPEDGHAVAHPYRKPITI